MRLLERFSGLKMKYKLILAYALLVIVLVFALTGIQHTIGRTFVYDLTGQQFARISSMTERALNDRLNLFFKGVFSAYSQTMLNDPRRNSGKDDTGALAVEIQRALAEISYGNPEIAYLQYLAPDGRFYEHNVRSRGLRRPADGGSLAQECEVLAQKHGQPTWEAGDEDSFVMKIALFSTEDISYRGCMAVSVSLDMLSNLFFSSAANPSEGFALLDRRDKVLFAENDAVRAVCEQALLSSGFARDSSFNLAAGGVNYLIQDVRLSKTGLTLLSALNLDAVELTSYELVSQTVPAAMLLAAISLMVVVLFSQKLTWRLSSLLSNVKSERDAGEPARPRRDEVEQLADEFSLISTRLDQVMSDYLTEKELKQKNEYLLLEAKYTALQLALNPHSMYNILDSLYAIAVLGGDERLGRLIGLLADYLRTNLKHAGKIGTLREELEHVRLYLDLYLDIMQGKLSARWEVDESLLDLPMPFMLLTPLVENAVEHGVGKKAVPGEVVVRACGRAGRALLEVADDGVGIAPDALKKLLSGELEQTKKHARIGVKSTFDRLNLLYGEACQAEIESTPGAGTTVRILLPLEIR